MALRPIERIKNISTSTIDFVKRIREMLCDRLVSDDVEYRSRYRTRSNYLLIMRKKAKSL